MAAICLGLNVFLIYTKIITAIHHQRYHLQQISTAWATATATVGNATTTAPWATTSPKTTTTSKCHEDTNDGDGNVMVMKNDHKGFEQS